MILLEDEEKLLMDTISIWLHLGRRICFLLSGLHIVGTDQVFSSCLEILGGIILINKELQATSIPPVPSSSCQISSNNVLHCSSNPSPFLLPPLHLFVWHFSSSCYRTRNEFWWANAWFESTETTYWLIVLMGKIGWLLFSRVHEKS